MAVRNVVLYGHYLQLISEIFHPRYLAFLWKVIWFMYLTCLYSLDWTGLGFYFGVLDTCTTCICWRHGPCEWLSQGHVKINLKVQDNLCWTNLEINLNKIANFYRTSKIKKTSFINAVDSWSFNKRNISFINPGDWEKYLGTRIDSWVGCSPGISSDKLEECGNNLLQAGLHPLQKVELLKNLFYSFFFFKYHLSFIRGLPKWFS